ncbi:hypothetical protein [Pseudooceanicola atlanticus]|jgi:putative copper export protein|uniref:Copper resistance protein D domain-containing protein n=1 Tax=Pseudooceanicola atlanticus TaxID=1461694 RepID=A0A0A0EDB8_9RHOB|nr:hypothetical protein [Pseudooceanicola atlanticus]KGM48374.1 hypothetical protein ATO9_12050 [Pseudooceanicola atlanticus]
MLTTIIHYVHLLTAAIWMGGTLVLAWGFLPALAQLNAPEARAIWASVAMKVAPMMGFNGGMVILAGGARAWMSGNIPSFGALLDAYGLLVIGAFLLTFLSEALGGRLRQQVAIAMQNEVTYHERMGQLVRGNIISQSIICTAIVAIMAVLGLGLY